MNISEDLFFNIVKDWEKKDISSEEKGRFVKEYIEENKISEREFARRIGIPKSTINDWITNRQIKKYYDSKKNEVYATADKLLVLLKKTGSSKSFDDKTLRKIRELKSEIEKLDVIEI